MSGSGSSGATRQITWITFAVVLGGLATAIGALVIVAIDMDNAEDMITVLAPLLAFIGTLVGGVVGVRFGSDGKEQVQNELMGAVHTMTTMSTTRDEGLSKANEQLLQSVKAREEFALALATRATQTCTPTAAPSAAGPCCNELSDINASLKTLIDVLAPRTAGPAAAATTPAPDRLSTLFDAKQFSEIIALLNTLIAAIGPRETKAKTPEPPPITMRFDADQLTQIVDAFGRPRDEPTQQSTDKKQDTDADQDSSGETQS